MGLQQGFTLLFHLEKLGKKGGNTHRFDYRMLRLPVPHLNVSFRPGSDNTWYDPAA